jgi:hypothetical protein
MDGLSAPVVDGDAMVPIVDRDGLGTGTTTNGLTPALPISTEPIGIPARAPPAGDADDIAADDEALLLEPVPQTAVLPGDDVPVPTPIPPPSKFVLELDIPDEGLAIAEQVVPKPVIPMVPLIAGLSPGDASSVAPMGIPVGATDEPGVMPSGEVAAIPGVGMPTPPTCAAAGLQPMSAACIAAINMRRIIVSIFPTQRSGRANRSSRPTLSISLFGACWILSTLLKDCCTCVTTEISGQLAGTIKLAFRKLNSILIKPQVGRASSSVIGASAAAQSRIHLCSSPPT